MPISDDGEPHHIELKGIYAKKPDWARATLRVSAVDNPRGWCEDPSPAPY